jgi:hypothetical protein
MMVVTSVHETTAVEKTASKSLAVSAQEGACCTGLPARLPIKENPGEPDP